VPLPARGDPPAGPTTRRPVRALLRRAVPPARAKARTLLQANPQNLSFERHQSLNRPDRDLLGGLSGFRVPTLIIVGACDIPDVHAHAGAFEAGIAGARRIVLPDAGHLAYLEQPERFNQAVTEFLALLTRRLSPVAADRHFDSGLAPVEGGALYYEVQGAGDAVVLIHGGLLDHRMWDEQFDSFAQRYRVVRYDVRGHGLSTGGLVASRDHEDLCRLLQHLGIARAHVIGLSLGGRIAVDFALQHPDMVRSVIPVGPGLSGYEFTDAKWDEIAQAIRTAVAAGNLEEAAELFQRAWTDGPRRAPAEVDPAVRRRVRTMIDRNIRPGWDLSRHLPPEPPAVGRLTEIHAPMLIVLGELDMPDIHKIVDQLTSQVAGARKVVIPGAAHNVSLERPVEFDRAVLEFLSSQ